MEKTELLACPHCDGDAKHYAEPSADGDLAHWCICSVCGAKTATYYEMLHGSSAKQFAIAAWNRRTPTEEQHKSTELLHLDEIRARYADSGLSQDNYKQMTTAELARMRLDVKRLLLYIDQLSTPTEADNKALTVEELQAYRAIGTVEEFRAMKEAEQDGRLVVLPCKVGSTVFVISKCQNVKMSRDDDYFTGTGAMECPFESDRDTEDCNDEHTRIFETTLSDFWYGDETGKHPEMFF